MKNILKNKNALLGILVVGIIAMTIAFAALTTQLNIVGTAKVSQQNFKVVIDDWARDNNQPSLITNGTNTAYEITPASVTSNTMTISNLKVGFRQPGDAIKYNFNIENQGTIDATLSSFSIGTPTCTNALTSESVTCPSMTYEVKCGSPAAVPQVGDDLAAGATIPCTYYLAYNEVNQQGNITQPALEVSNITASWTYVQKTSSNVSPAPVVTSWEPSYFAFGTPTTSDTTIPDKDVFVGMDTSGNKGVCIKKNGITCFQANNASYEQQHVQEVFPGTCEYNSSNGIWNCDGSDFDCHVSDDGYVDCISYADISTCDVNSDGGVDCY